MRNKNFDRISERVLSQIRENDRRTDSYYLQDMGSMLKNFLAQDHGSPDQALQYSARAASLYSKTMGMRGAALLDMVKCGMDIYAMKKSGDRKGMDMVESLAYRLNPGLKERQPVKPQTMRMAAC